MLWGCAQTNGVHITRHGFLARRHPQCLTWVWGWSRVLQIVWVSPSLRSSVPPLLFPSTLLKSLAPPRRRSWPALQKWTRVKLSEAHGDLRLHAGGLEFALKVTRHGMT